MLRQFARFILWISGWKIVGQPAPVEKCVIAVAFHTSNWDALPCLAANVYTKLYVSWLGKSTIFWGPIGAALKFMGGIPIVRSSHEDLVHKIVDEFRSRDRFVLSLAPEGTRQKVAKWRSGFYQIARQAGVPIQPAALDYKHMNFVFGPLVYPSADPDSDIAKLREFFSQFEPKHPHLADPNFTVDISSN